MKTKRFLFLLTVVTMGLQCLPAVSTTFESARMLKPGALQVGAYGSLYTGILDKHQGDEWGLRTLNFGLISAYGLSDKFSIRGRYERTLLKDRAELFDAPILQSGTGVNYAEIALKYGWKQRRSNLRGAVSLPIGNIFYHENNVWYLSPTVFTTFSNNDQFEFSMNGKLHFWLNNSPPIPWASFGIGFGFSENLDRWALRPEINTDIVNFSFGLGFSYTFQVAKTP